MKVLISDFDKTLFTKDYQKNIKAINDFVDKGNIFVIATGRNLVTLTHDLDKNLKFNYLICNDGGVIYDKNFKTIYRKDIDNNLVKPIFDVLKKDISVGDPLIDLTFDYSYNLVGNANAIIARIIDYKKASKLLDFLLSNFSNITGYISDNWINIDDKSVNKGNGIINLCKIIDYNYKDVYAIGDNTNDISMCEICHGFCMVDGSLKLKENCEDSVENVAMLIDKL